MCGLLRVPTREFAAAQGLPLYAWYISVHIGTYRYIPAREFAAAEESRHASPKSVCVYVCVCVYQVSKET
jgi:hypothetical protein